MPISGSNWQMIKKRSFLWPKTVIFQSIGGVPIAIGLGSNWGPGLQSDCQLGGRIVNFEWKNVIFDWFYQSITSTRLGLQSGAPRGPPGEAPGPPLWAVLKVCDPRGTQDPLKNGPTGQLTIRGGYPQLGVPWGAWGGPPGGPLGPPPDWLIGGPIAIGTPIDWFGVNSIGFWSFLSILLIKSIILVVFSIGLVVCNWNHALIGKRWLQSSMFGFC